LITNNIYCSRKNINSINKGLDALINKYQKRLQPIEVNFRSFFPKLNNSDRATHLIHTYPAKLLVHIPYFFLNNNILSKYGGSILDPFCGSGTVLLESLLANKNAYGVDSNPLARLISKVKTQSYDIHKLYRYIDTFKKYEGTVKGKSCPSVVNIDYWFLPNIQKQLLEIFDIEIELAQMAYNWLKVGSIGS
jgi:hypothetical protein